MIANQFSRFPWQDLTLARLEFYLGIDPQNPLIKVIDDLLWYVQIPHMPLPYIVEPVPNLPGEGVALGWNIEGRTLEFRVWPDGAILYQCRGKKPFLPPHRIKLHEDDTFRKFQLLIKWLLWGAFTNPQESLFTDSVKAEANHEEVLH